MTTMAQKRRRELRAVTREGISFSVMVGVGESYLPAFVLALGLSEVTAGLIVTIPLLSGAVVQLVSPYLIRRLASYRRWTIICSVIQGLSFLPLLAAALRGSLAGILLFAIAIVYWAAGMATGPAWNAWMEQVVPRRIRHKYFAWRSGLAQGAVLISLVAAGFALHFAAGRDNVLLTFAVIFGVAALARLNSARLHRSVRERPFDAKSFRVVSFVEMIRRVDKTHEMRLFVFILCMQSAVYVAAPYFTPFMLGRLELGYHEYVILIAASFVAKVLMLTLLGHYARHLKPYRLLTLGSYAIIPLSLAWIFSDNYYYLLGLQIFAGLAWAFFELALMLLIFETIAEHERSSILTIFNLAQALAMTLGSAFGAAILSTLGQTKFAYFVLFAASFAARGIAIYLLKWVERVPIQPQPISIRTLAVRASEGSIDRPVLAELEEVTTDQDAHGVD